MNEEIEAVIEIMCQSGYWPHIITKEGELTNLFFLSDDGKLIQYFMQFIEV
jgi:uncharacterized protein YllA (UPF0747 family)